MNSFISWVGGKKALREEVVKRFPLNYDKYVEVFGGAGWVLFHKPQRRDIEIYNDFNSLLVNLFRCVRNKPDELKDSLRYVLNSREDFEYIRNTLARDSPASDIQKASWFYQIIRYSYGSALQSYGGRPHSIRADFPLIEQASIRLQDVIIEHRDFECIIRQQGGKGTICYCDPPYHSTEGYYQNIGEDGFTEADHIRLRNVLLSTGGYFLLSYNDDDFIRDLYDHPGIYIEPVTRLDNFRQRYEPNCQFRELFISNYDTSERQRSRKQFSLFDPNYGNWPC